MRTSGGNNSRMYTFLTCLSMIRWCSFFFVVCRLQWIIKKKQQQQQPKHIHPCVLFYRRRQFYLSHVCVCVWIWKISNVNKMIFYSHTESKTNTEIHRFFRIKLRHIDFIKMQGEWLMPDRALWFMFSSIFRITMRCHTNWKMLEMSLLKNFHGSIIKNTHSQFVRVCVCVRLCIFLISIFCIS